MIRSSFAHRVHCSQSFSSDCWQDIARQSDSGVGLASPVFSVHTWLMFVRSFLKSNRTRLNLSHSSLHPLNPNVALTVRGMSTNEPRRDNRRVKLPTYFGVIVPPLHLGPKGLALITPLYLLMKVMMFCTTFQSSLLLIPSYVGSCHPLFHRPSFLISILWLSNHCLLHGLASIFLLCFSLSQV